MYSRFSCEDCEEIYWDDDYKSSICVKNCRLEKNIQEHIIMKEQENISVDVNRI